MQSSNKPFRRQGGGSSRGSFRPSGGFRQGGERRQGGSSFGGARRSGSDFGGSRPSSFGGRSAADTGHERFERRRRFIDRARDAVKEAYTGKGASLIQSIRAIDDIDSAVSLLQMRLKEFSAINFPEFKLENEESFARVLREFGRREALVLEPLAKLVGETKATELISKSTAGFGAEFTEEEAVAVRSIASATAELYKSRRELEKFVNAECNVVLKNISFLIEPVVAARLLSAAGSLVRLAELPSSTIQVIGAEKSLFKHLRTGSPPPKHGLIFNCQMVRTAPKENRGSIARALSGKIAIAAKADAFTGNFIAPMLKEALEKTLSKRGK